MNYIYVHGFNSAGKVGSKYKLFSDAFGKDSVHTIDLSYIPDVAIQQLTELISQYPDAVLIGSSLGGFYAKYLSKKFSMSCVLLNPAIDPIATCKKFIGNNVNIHTGKEYILACEHVDMLSKYYVAPETSPMVPTLVFLDKDDKLFDSTLTQAYFEGCAKVKMFDGGSHRFEHTADILDDIASLEFLMFNEG